MKNFMRVLLAGAVLATAAFAQENTGANGPDEDQKQAPAADSQCCNKDCCKHKAAKKGKAGKGDTAKKESGASCCK